MIFRILLLLAALLSFGGIAHAGDKPLYAPAPGWALPAPAIDPAKLTDEDPIFLHLDQQQRIEKGQVWVYVNTAMRIASSQLATQAGNIVLPWLPNQGDLIVHSVEILRDGERIDVLAKGSKFTVIQREQGLEQASLNGMLTATLSVEGLRVGDVLRVAYSFTRKDDALGGNVQTVAPLIGDPMRVGFARVRVMWPSSDDLHWRTYVKDPGTKESDQGGWRELTVTVPLAKQPEMPGDAPARYQRPSILEASSFADWRAVSKTMGVHYQGTNLIPPGSPLAAEVEKIRAASADPRVRAAMALQLVQDKVRYLFRGMDDGNYVPQSPMQTWASRFGDCKAKSYLLLAILRELGIEADVVAVSISAGDLVSQRLPMPGAFDHVIVRAAIGGETLWLDGTGSGSRLADLLDVPPFRHALPLTIAGSDLVAMPMRVAARPEADALVEIDQRAGILLPAPFKVTMRIRGPMAEMMRTASAQMEKKQLNDMLDGMAGTNVGGVIVVASRKLSYDEATSMTVITAEGLAWPRWEKDGEIWKLPLDQTMDELSFSPDRARVAWREIPVASGSPGDTRRRVILTLPGAGAGFTLEGNQTLPATLGGVVLTRSTGLNGAMLTVDDRVVSGINEIAPADIPAARQQVTQAKTRLLKARAPADYPPVWRLAEAGRRNKAFEPIMAMFARYIADDPEAAERYTNRGSFLQNIYDRPGALRDMDKAISIEPTTERYLWRANLRSQTGDDKGATADIRAALELEPGSSAATRMLANQLSKAGKHDEALALIAEQIEQGGGQERNGFVSTQASLLGEAGRAEEGIAALDKAITAAPGNPSLLNSRCWLKGTANLALDTALRDCTKSIELSENPAAALDSRGMIYFRLGRFDDALADLDAALTHSPNMAASLFLRGVILKRQGKSGDADLAAARLISPRIDEDYARYGIKP